MKRCVECIHAGEFVTATAAFHFNGSDEATGLNHKINLTVISPPVKELTLFTSCSIDQMTSNGRFNEMAFEFRIFVDFVWSDPGLCRHKSSIEHL